MTTAPPSWPLVGRDTETALLADALDQDACGVVVAGPAGVGRTRLAREAAAMARQRGRPVRLAAASRAAAAVPLGALAHLVPPAPVGATDTDLIGHAVAALTAQEGLVLVVDDADRLDPLAVTLVHRLAAAGSVTLVATVPASGPDPTAELWMDDHAVRIDLGPLPRGHSEELIGRVLGGDVDSRTCEQLWRLSRGNPRVLRELVESGLDDGRLARCDGLWRWSGAMEPAPRLERIVLGQLGECDGPERAAMEVLAVAGALPLAWLVELAGHEPVARLERAGLVAGRPADDGGPVEVRLVEPVHGLVLAARLPAAEVARIRGRVLAAGPGPDRLQTARLLLDAGHPGDPDVLVAAAHEAAAGANHPLAERLARAALIVDGGDRARTALAEALMWQGRAADADAEGAGGPGPTAARALNLALGLGRPAQARRMLDAAPPDAGGQLAATRAYLDWRGGELTEAVRRGRDVLADPAAAAGRPLAAAAAGAGLAAQGYPDEAMEVLERDAPGLSGLALEQARCLALLHAGRIGEATDRAAQRHRLALAAAPSVADAVAALHRGAAALAAGRVDVAARWLGEAEQGLAGCDPLDLHTGCAARLATARALLGRAHDAESLLTTLGDAPHPQVWRARVWVAAAAHRTAEAAELALRGADRAAAAGRNAMRVVLLHDAVRLGRAADAAGPLRALAERVTMPSARVAAEHAAALVAADPDRLDAVGDRFAELGMLLAAADVAAHAAAAHQRAGQHRRGAAATARARSLARTCGDPRTPALAQLRTPRITARERDVAQLAAAGMSNQMIARRLVLSIRTVESHLAHAYPKLGIGSRDELPGALGELRP